ncbi:MAG: hypothetical protein MZU95_01205 [Desulfomicrobium escambiense]|nr:hypothetical protein [Desulfomicrobium escambiense]
MRGWDRAEIQVRARVTANADTQQEADAIAAEVRVLTDGGRIRSEGRSWVSQGGWSVSFEVMAPAQHGLTLRTKNGGITVKGVHGDVDMETINGGITLSEVNGDVRGRTNNGGVQIDLSGDAWVGQGLDVQTHNGGVRLVGAGRLLGAPRGGDDATAASGATSRSPSRGRSARTSPVDLGRGGAPLKLSDGQRRRVGRAAIGGRRRIALSHPHRPDMPVIDAVRRVDRRLSDGGQRPGSSAA